MNIEQRQRRFSMIMIIIGFTVSILAAWSLIQQPESKPDASELRCALKLSDYVLDLQVLSHQYPGDDRITRLMQEMHTLAADLRLGVGFPSDESLLGIND